MDALQNDYNREESKPFGLWHVVQVILALFVGAVIVGCFFGAVTSVGAAIGPLSFVEAWNQFGATVAIVTGIISFGVCSAISSLIAVEAIRSYVSSKNNNTPHE